MKKRVFNVAIMVFTSITILSGTGSLAQSIPTGIGTVAWNPVDTNLLAEAGTDGLLQIRNTATEDVIELIGVTGTTFDVAWNPTGTQLASASDDTFIRIWNGSTGNLIKALTGHTAPVLGVDWSPDGNSLISTSSFIDETTNVKFWDVTSGLETASYRAGLVDGVAWQPLPNSSTIAITENLNGAIVVNINDLATNPDLLTLTSTLIGNQESVTSVAWKPDDTNQLAVGEGDGEITIWNVSTNTLITTLSGHTEWITDLSWSPDGSQLASVSVDGTLRIWDVINETQEHLITNTNGEIRAVDWKPGSRVVAYGGEQESADVIDFNNPPTANIPYSFTFHGQGFNDTYDDPVIVTVSNSGWTDDPDPDDVPLLTYQWEMQPYEGTYSVIYTGTDAYVDLNLGAVAVSCEPVMLRLTVTDPYGATASDTTSVNFIPAHSQGGGCDPGGPSTSGS